MHLVGFITKKFVTVHGHMNVKKKQSNSCLLRSNSLCKPIRRQTFAIPTACCFIPCCTELDGQLKSDFRSLRNGALPKRDCRVAHSS